MARGTPTNRKNSGNSPRPGKGRGSKLDEQRDVPNARAGGPINEFDSPYATPTSWSHAWNKAWSDLFRVLPHVHTDPKLTLLRTIFQQLSHEWTDLDVLEKLERIVRGASVLAPIMMNPALARDVTAAHDRILDEVSRRAPHDRWAKMTPRARSELVFGIGSFFVIGSNVKVPIETARARYDDDVRRFKSKSDEPKAFARAFFRAFEIDTTHVSNRDHQRRSRSSRNKS